MEILKTDRLKCIQTPVLLIHGTLDEVVPFHHAEMLYEHIDDIYKCKPFWIIGANHNNVELLTRYCYFMNVMLLYRYLLILILDIFNTFLWVFYFILLLR